MKIGKSEKDGIGESWRTRASHEPALAGECVRGDAGREPHCVGFSFEEKEENQGNGKAEISLKEGFNQNEPVNQKQERNPFSATETEKKHKERIGFSQGEQNLETSENQSLTGSGLERFKMQNQDNELTGIPLSNTGTNTNNEYETEPENALNPLGEMEEERKRIIKKRIQRKRETTENQSFPFNVADNPLEGFFPYKEIPPRGFEPLLPP